VEKNNSQPTESQGTERLEEIAVVEAGAKGKMPSCFLNHNDRSIFKPTVKGVVCTANIHTVCVAAIVQGQDDVPRNLFCSPQCICFLHDYTI
jgi:hypothetical protein